MTKDLSDVNQSNGIFHETASNVYCYRKFIIFENVLRENYNFINYDIKETILVEIEILRTFAYAMIFSPPITKLRFISNKFIIHSLHFLLSNKRK